MKKIVFLFFGILIGCSISSLAATVLRGPYLNMATQTSVHVRWRTDVATNSIVYYGTSVGSLSQSKVDATLVTEHDITINGLSLDTKYFYSIGATTPSVETYSEGAAYFFYTLPLKGTDRTTHIWALGDCGNNSSNQINVRNQYMQYMGNKHTDVMLLLGDNAYQSGTDAEYQTNFYPIYQDSVLRNVVLWPAPGNHDYANTTARQNDHNIPYFDMFSLPANAESGGVPSGTEAYYSYDFANIHFLSLDSYGKDSNTYFLYDTTGPQVRWIKQDLAANTQKWTIAYWHHPPFTMGSHNSETEADLINIRFKFIRILERYGVDLILCGHSHVYERSYLLNNYYSSEAAFNLATHAVSSSTATYDNSANSCPYIKNDGQKKGTVYVVSGSAGQLGGSLLNLAWPHNAMVYSNRDIGGGLAITVQGNRLDANWVCNDGIIRDRFTMMKDVNNRQTIVIPQGDSVVLSSSWEGEHSWPGGVTAKAFTYVGSSPKTDTVIVTDNFSCLRDSFIIKKNAVTGINTQSSDELQVKVYPNPSKSGWFSIDFSSNFINVAQVKVFDVAGKLLFADKVDISSKSKNYMLNLTAYPSGEYLLSIDNHVLKLIKP